jgi:hypothetical protein
MGDFNLLQLTSPATIPAKAHPRLVTGRELFDSLAAALKTRNSAAIQGASDQLNDYKDYWETRLGGDSVTLLLIARGLVSCAMQALSRPDDFESGTDRARQVLSSGVVDLHSQWEWITTRELLIESGFLSVKTAATVRVPIAFRRQTGQKSQAVGRLALLEVKLLKKGSGAVAHQPRDAFDTRCGQDFVGAMADAWNLARSGDTRFDGVWRILPWDVALFDPNKDGRPYGEGPVNGRSAGGAAARAWALALRGMVEDSGIICMLSVNRHATEQDSSFESVEGIKEKVSEVASKSDWFDTILVSPDERGPMRNNYSDALSALGESAGRIRVVPI